MLNLDSIRTTYVCQVSAVELFNSNLGAAMATSEDDAIIALPEGFRCQLPDGSMHEVCDGAWLQTGQPHIVPVDASLTISLF